MNENIDFMRFDTALTAEEIIDWLHALRARSCAPYSSYLVTGVVETRMHDKTIYFAGVNVENAEPGLGTHGEEGALAAMVTALGKQARAQSVWVMGGSADQPHSDKGGSSCGRCRQRIAGLAASSDMPVHTVALSGDVVSHTIGALLPDSFSFSDIPAVVTKEKNMSTPQDAETTAQRLIRKGEQSPEQIFEWLQSLSGIDAASGRQQSSVIKLANGAYAAGVRIEDAAYTGINAVQAAKAISVAAFGHISIEDVWLLHKGVSSAGRPLFSGLVRQVADNENASVMLFDETGAKELLPDYKAV